MGLSKVRFAAKEFGLSKLHKGSGVARSRLYDFVNGADLSSENLFKVLECLGYGLRVVKLDEQNSLDSSLGAYGAPVLRKAKNPKLKLEEALLGALMKAPNDSTYFEFVVYLLLKKELNFQSLLDVVRLPVHRQLLGYAAELAETLDGKRSFKELTLELKNDKYPPFSFSGSEKPGKYGAMRSRLKPNPLAKKWNVRTNTTPEMLRDRFEKWDRMNKKEQVANVS